MLDILKYIFHDDLGKTLAQFLSSYKSHRLSCCFFFFFSSAENIFHSYDRGLGFKDLLGSQSRTGAFICNLNSVCIASVSNSLPMERNFLPGVWLKF